MKNNWKIYIVRYWNHSNSPIGNVNDCFGNSLSKLVKARTESEALRKTKGINANGIGTESINFRLHSIKLK